MKPTYDELLALVETQNKIILEQKQIIERLEKRVAELEEQLKLNSKNSSKPPSTDKKISLEPPKKGGAKPGHPGHFRPLFSKEEVHKVETLQVTACPTCGSEVHETNEPPSIHQQVELPEVCFEVTQYERHEFYCPCCRKYGLPDLPKEVGSSCFGTRLTAFVSFLSGTCKLSKREVLKVLGEGLKIKAAVGSISNIERRISTALETPYLEIQQEVRSSMDAKHIDETSWRTSGQTYYLWLMSTYQATLYKIQEGRNSVCLHNLLGGIKHIKAPYITDRLPIYQFEKNHQYCLAHLRRDFRKFSGRQGLDGHWGEAMLFCLDKLFELWKEFIKKKINRRRLKHKTKWYRDALIYGLTLARYKMVHSLSLRRFAKKLLPNFKKLFVFIDKEGLEPTNNQAERDLRHAVIWRKICYGTKSERGNRFVERILSVFGTLSRQKQSSLSFLIQATHAMKVGLPAPKVLNQAC